MDDYIKREDALKAVDDIVCDADDAERTCNRIIDLPSADVAPVVRCKDCKHCEYASNRIPTEQAWVCYKWGVDVEQDGFCAVAERKDDDGQR